MPAQHQAPLPFRLTADDVGQRVTVRRRLPEGGYADAIGELESWSEGVLRVRRRDGSLTEIPEDNAVAGKVVPPPPPRRRPRSPG